MVEPDEVVCEAHEEASSSRRERFTGGVDTEEFIGRDAERARKLDSDGASTLGTVRFVMADHANNDGPRPA